MLLIILIVFLPIYAMLIGMYKDPKESLLWGKRGMFKEEPELTEAAIENAKKMAVYGLIFLTWMLLLGMVLIYLQDKAVFLRNGG